MTAERLLRSAAAVLVGIGVVVAVLLFAQSHDNSAVEDRAPSAPGAAVPSADPVVRAPLRRDGGVLTEDQIRTATQAGDVVLLGDGGRALATLRALQTQLGPFDPKLAALGQSVVVGRRPGQAGVVARARGRELTVRSASDPQLEAFVDAYLGGGASG